MDRNNVVVPSHEVLSSINNNLACSESDCNATFKSSSNLKMHLVKTHKKSIDLGTRTPGCKYHCPSEECKYNLKSKIKFNYFPTFKYLKQHYLKCHAVKSMKCNLCDKGFAAESFLLAHTKFCGQKFVCSCGCSYISRGALLTHCKRKNHTPSKKKKISKNDLIDPLPASDNTLVQVCIGAPPQSSKSPRKQTHDITVFPTHYVAAIALSELSTTLIIPKNCHIGVQTVETKLVKKALDKNRKHTQETQTSLRDSAKKTKLSAETQTSDNLQHKPECRKICRKRKRSIETQTKDLMPFLPSVNNESLDGGIFNESSLSNCSSDDRKCLDFDGAWSKNIMSPPQKNLTKTKDFHSFDNLCNIETQTDIDSFLSLQNEGTSSIETQTTDDLIEDMYSNMCTQTCSETCDLFDFNFVDIETQTAWPNF